MRPIVAVLALGLLASCGSQNGAAVATATPAPPEGTVAVRFSQDAVVTAEVAATDAERQRGLMHRNTLPEDAGMLFLFASQRSPEQGFWMMNTRIPLSIAYLDRTGDRFEVVALRDMEPCRSDDPGVCIEEAEPYRPGVPYDATLEVNRGWFAEHGIEVGSTAEVSGPLPTPDP